MRSLAIAVLILTTASLRADELEEQDRRAQQYIEVLRYGNGWARTPTDADIAAAVGKIPRGGAVTDDITGSVTRFAIGETEIARVHGASVDPKLVGGGGPLANQVVLAYVKTTTTVEPARLGHAERVYESVDHVGCLLRGDGADWTFESRASGSAEDVAAWRRAFADGWISGDDPVIAVKGHDGEDLVHAPLSFEIAATRAGAPLPGLPIALRVTGGLEGLIRHVDVAREEGGWRRVTWDDERGVSLGAGLRTGRAGALAIRLYVDLGALALANLRLPREIALEAWTPRPAGETDRPDAFTGAATVTLRHGVFVRGVLLQRGEIEMRYPDTPWGTIEATIDRMTAPPESVALLPEAAERDKIYARVRLDGRPYVPPVDGTVFWQPVEAGTRLHIDLGGFNTTFMGNAGARPPVRQPPLYWPQYGDKVGMMVEWLDGTVAAFMARSRPEGSTQLLVRLLPQVGVYGRGPKLAYFLGKESVQFAVEVVVETGIAATVGLPALALEAGYLIYRGADALDDAGEIAEIVAGDGTFVRLQSRVALRTDGRGRAALDVLEGHPSIESAGGAVTEVVAGQGVDFTVGGEVGAPVARPAPAWALPIAAVVSAAASLPGAPVAAAPVTPSGDEIDLTAPALVIGGVLLVLGIALAIAHDRRRARIRK